MPGRPSKSQRSVFGARLNALRHSAGFTQQQVASQLGISQPSYALWERDDVAIRPDQLRKLAEILDVGVDELLQGRKSRGRSGPTGKARRVFETVSELPRRQQEKIIEVVEALIAGHKRGGRVHKS